MMVRMGRSPQPALHSPPNKPADLPVSGTLPASLTSFVGRERELGELRSLFAKGNDSPPWSVTNLSRVEIPAELSVSLNTVGSIPPIYAKLGAEDRATVVQRTRAPRLLSIGQSLQTSRTRCLWAGRKLQLCGLSIDRRSG